MTRWDDGTVVLAFFLEPGISLARCRLIAFCTMSAAACWRIVTFSYLPVVSVIKSTSARSLSCRSSCFFVGRSKSSESVCEDNEMMLLIQPRTLIGLYKIDFV